MCQKQFHISLGSSYLWNIYLYLGFSQNATKMNLICKIREPKSRRCQQVWREDATAKMKPTFISFTDFYFRFILCLCIIISFLNYLLLGFVSNLLSANLFVFRFRFLLQFIFL